MSTIHSDLSGEGDVDMTGASFPGLFRIKVTNPGIAHPVGSDTVVKRWVDFGWIAPFESGVPSEQDGPGTFYYAAQFIEFELQTFDWVGFANDVHGIDGLHYSFKPGVVADIVVL
jgi:hypothetical protein